MKERRLYERLSDKLPVRLEAITSRRIKVLLHVKTKDISSGGLFIYTKEVSYIPEDTRFIMDIAIPSKNKELKNLEKCAGTMVRSTAEGIAIHFDKDH